MTTLARWDAQEYQRICDVTGQGDNLTVVFEDGATATIRKDRLLPPHTENPQWQALRSGRFEITVPADMGEVEISWSTIRALTDAAFSAHLAAAADEQARHIGRRIKELREGRGLASKDLAERASITPQSMSRIEHGHHDVSFTTLRRILAAMGCSLRDLTTPEEDGADSGFAAKNEYNLPA